MNVELEMNLQMLAWCQSRTEVSKDCIKEIENCSTIDEAIARLKSNLEIKMTTQNEYSEKVKSLRERQSQVHSKD